MITQSVVRTHPGPQATLEFFPAGSSGTIRMGTVDIGVRVGGVVLEGRALTSSGLVVDLACSPETLPGAGAWCRLTVSVRNTSAVAVPIDAVVIRTGGLVAPRALTRHLLNGEAMVDYSVIVPVAEGREGCWCVGFSDEAGEAALVAGFERLDDACSHFRVVARDGAAAGLEIEVDREGIGLASGAGLAIAPLLIGAGTGLSALMETYAEAVGRAMKARRSAPATGWCSWYDFYGTETQDDVVENLHSIVNSPLRDAIDYIQIDDGWNLPHPGHPRVWGDWTQGGAKFPQGMKAIADTIRAQGKRAGLWLAPFGVDPASRLFRDHPEWLIQNEDGSGPKNFWGVYGLDLSQQATLDFVRETFVRVFDEWGYDYIKIDFLLYAAFKGRRARRDLTRMQCVRRGLEVIDRVARGRYILTCGCPVGPAIGVCDAFRVGFDVSARWFVPLNVPTWPVGNCCVRAGAAHSIGRQWMHGHWWQNDTDCHRVGREASAGEVAMFAKEFEGKFATEPPYGLSDEEAGFWTRLVWLTGGLAFLSERQDKLPADRLALLHRAYPLNAHPGRVVDHYADLDVVVMRTHTGPLRVGVFNLGETAKRVVVPAERLGTKAATHWREWHTGETFASAGAEVAFPELPARAGRIWEAIG